MYQEERGRGLISIEDCVELAIRNLMCIFKVMMKSWYRRPEVISYMEQKQLVFSIQKRNKKIYKIRIQFSLHGQYLRQTDEVWRLNLVSEWRL